CNISSRPVAVDLAADLSLQPAAALDSSYARLTPCSMSSKSDCAGRVATVDQSTRCMNRCQGRRRHPNVTNQTDPSVKSRTSARALVQQDLHVCVARPACFCYY